MTLPMGVTLHTGDMGMSEIICYAREAESLGYDGYWLLEESGKEAFATLGELAGVTERIRLGTSIVSFYSRTPTLLAMAARTIDDLSGGRFALGIGARGGRIHCQHAKRSSGGGVARHCRGRGASCRMRPVAHSHDDAAANMQKFSLAGSPAVCRRKLRCLIDNGVHPIIYPLPRAGRIVEDHLAAIRIAAKCATSA
ncbi:MAG: LLM class flavin-dependent oxidoreductase [Acidobacteria bacterium]|nr:LLM class flavin-dependent oxidoreductase [Acidobacteriota bacterium]